MIPYPDFTNAKVIVLGDIILDTGHKPTHHIAIKKAHGKTVEMVKHFGTHPEQDGLTGIG